MPYHPPKRRKCRKGDGTSGSWVIDKKLSGGKSKQTSCHDSEAKASASIKARKISEKTVKITNKQLKRIINEYEQYVDEDGNIYDDEGNVERRGKEFGRMYGGQTYGGTRTPWGPSRSSRKKYPPRKTGFVGASVNAKKIAAVEEILKSRPNSFLKSILDQLKKGRSLSSKQKAIVKKIVARSDPSAGKLFERNDRSVNITVKQLKRIIREALDITQLSLEDLEYQHSQLMGHLSGQASGGGDRRDIETMGEDIVDMRDRMSELRAEQGLPEKDYSDNGYRSAEQVVQGEIKYRARGY